MTEVAAPVSVPRENGFAIASLVLGILGVVTPASVLAASLAVIFGAIGRDRARRGAPHGSLATAGFVLGIAAIVIWILVFVFLFAVVAGTGSGTSVQVP
jgi:hypothetical protein